MPWPEQEDYVEPVAREAVGEYVTLLDNLDPSTYQDKLADLARRMDRIGLPIIHAFAEALGHSSLSARISAATYLLAIAERSPSIVPQTYSDKAGIAIVEALGADGAENLMRTLLILCSSGSVPAVAVRPLEGIFARPADPRLRLFAASALTLALTTSAEVSTDGISLSTLLPVLVSALNAEEDEPMAVVAASALARLGVRGSTVVDELAEAMEKGNPHLRLANVIALSKVRPPSRRAIEVLSGVSADVSEDSLVRIRATKALVEMASDPREVIPTILRAAATGDWPPFEGGVSGLVARGDLPDEVADLVIELLDHDNPELRGTAAWWLSCNGPAARRATSTLIDQICQEQFPDVYHLLLSALKAASLAAVAPLVEILRQGDMRRVSHAIAALVTIGSAAVPDVIRVLLTDEDPRVRMTGLYVLREVGPAAASAGQEILSLLCRAVGEERESAVMALVAISPDLPDAIPILIEELCSGCGETVFWASKGLCNLGHRARPAVERARHSASPTARARLDAVLVELQSAGGGPPGDLELFGDDDALELFAWVGYLLNRYGPLSAQNLGKILIGKHRTIRDDRVKHRKVKSISASHIRGTVKKIEKQLFGKKRLTTRDANARKPGILKPEAKALLERVQQYLRRKERWPLESA